LYLGALYFGDFDLAALYLGALDFGALLETLWTFCLGNIVVVAADAAAAKPTNKIIVFGTKVYSTR
jgi:hypothetical protein